MDERPEPSYSMTGHAAGAEWGCIVLGGVMLMSFLLGMFFGFMLA